MDWSFVKSKFDNICLMILIVFLVSLLTWGDKHNNGDFVKWLEVFTAGIGGAYLGLITAARQAWEKKTQEIDGHTLSTTTVKGVSDKGGSSIIPPQQPANVPLG